MRSKVIFLEERRAVSIVRSFLEEKGYDAAIVSSWQNVYYCSGFTGYGDALLLITKDKKFIVTDSRYYVQAEKQAGDYTLVKSPAWGLKVMTDILEQEKVKKLCYHQRIEGNGK